MFKGHYHESMPSKLRPLFEKRDVGCLKVDLWNAFADSGLIGINDDDCSALPRFLPLSYFPTIDRTCRDIALFLMRLLSLPAREIKSIIPGSPVVDFLIDELRVLDHRQRRITGSLRYDLAIVGRPVPGNPPRLFEVNEIGFDGTGRSSFIQETMLRVFPELKRHVRCLDTAASEVKNMRRLGRSIARMQYNYYNWEEEVILMKAKRAGLDLRLVSPSVFNVEIEDECEKLRPKPVTVKDGRVTVGGERWRPDAFQISYSFELSDYIEAAGFFAKLVRAKTPQYSPFITGLIAPKTILMLLDDDVLCRRLLGSGRARGLKPSILPSMSLSGNEGDARRRAPDLVMKHADGMGGELVYVGGKITNKIRRIPKAERKHWVVQDRIDLNTIDVDGFLSRRRRVVADLGAYIHYDWNGERFTNFSVGGFITRATNRGLKVNVSGGGIQVPVMFYR